MATVSLLRSLLKRSDDVSTIRHTLRDCLIGLTALLLAYGLYQFGIVPWLEPSHVRQTATAGTESPTATPLLPARIAAFFPIDSWERKAPRLLATSSGMVLFQTNESHPDGRMVIRPCTLILHASSDSRDSQPIIVRAPDGAVLRFDRPFGITQASLGKFLGGQLEGTVTIERPESHPGAGDRFRAETRSIQINPGRIWTSHEVEFQFGRHYGSGNELIVSLTNARQNSGAMALGRPNKLELVHVDQIVLEIPPPKTKLPTNPSAKKGEPSTLRLTCDGSFVFDFLNQTATLQKTVRGVHVTPSGLIDQMTSQVLEVGFLKQAAVTPSDNDSSSGLALHHINLKGNPARVDAPSQQLNAAAATINVDYFNSRIQLEDPTTSKLNFQQHQLTASRIDYTMVPDQPKRLGRFEAIGPGEYRQRRETEQLVVQWNGSVTLQPYGGEHVLALPQGATVALGNSTSFRADEAYIWLVETVDDSAPQTEYRVAPRKLRAAKQVVFSLQGLSGQTKLLECWFSESPDAASPSDATETAPRAAPASNRLWSRPREGDARPERRYVVQAQTMRLQWIRYRNKWEISQGQLIGQVSLEEQPGGLLQGDTVELLRDPDGLARLDLFGRPAVVARDGMVLKGETIHVDQTIGRMWMDGQGEMAIPPRTRPASPTAQPVVMRWESGMDFDGRTAVFRQAVSIAGEWRHQGKPDVSRFTVEGNSMQATVTPPIDFRQPPKRSKTTIDQVTFPGPVIMRHELRGSGSALQSRDELHVQDLELEYATGDFRSRHPGWGESIRIGSTLRGSPAPAGPAQPAGTGLVYLRVDFQQAMSGNYLKRSVNFRDRVRAIVGPVASWEEKLDPNRPDRLGLQAFLLNCNDLTVVQAPGTQPPAVELHATGSVRVDGRQFSATGDRLVYDQHKDILLLAGKGRVPARIRFRSSPTAAASQVAAGSIRYSPGTGQLLSSDIQGGTIVGPQR